MEIQLTWIFWILLYVIVVLILIWWTNKVTKDSKVVLSALSANINSYFFIINKVIAQKKADLEKFDDLIEVLYAKKKWFLHNKTHTIADQYELFLNLKDWVEYLSDYASLELVDVDLNKQSEGYFSFLFSIRPRQKSLRFFLLLFTLGLGSWFIQDSAKL